MVTENLSTLKIHKLTQEQYDRELENGSLEYGALYLTPEKEYATVEQLGSHGHPTATKSSDGFMSQVDANKLSILFPSCTTSEQVSPPKLLSWTLQKKGWWSIQVMYEENTLSSFGLIYWNGLYDTVASVKTGSNTEYVLSVLANGIVTIKRYFNGAFDKDLSSANSYLYGICLIEDASLNT